MHCWSVKRKQSHLGLVPADLGEITSWSYLEHLTHIIDLDGYKKLIELLVRIRVYSVSEFIICFVSQVISRSLRATW